MLTQSILTFMLCITIIRSTKVRTMVGDYMHISEKIIQYAMDNNGIITSEDVIFLRNIIIRIKSSLSSEARLQPLCGRFDKLVPVPPGRFQSGGSSEVPAA